MTLSATRHLSRLKKSLKIQFAGRDVVATTTIADLAPIRSSQPPLSRTDPGGETTGTRGTRGAGLKKPRMTNLTPVRNKLPNAREERREGQGKRRTANQVEAERETSLSEGVARTGEETSRSRINLGVADLVEMA